MPTALRVLILEDNPSDAELAIHELERAGFGCDWQRVQTERDYLAALKPAPDIILADYSLPQFDGLAALRLLASSKLDIPFIIVSGQIGEETAVECMQEGADDYVWKDHLARLGVAVKRALEQKRLRGEARRVISRNQQLSRVFEQNPASIIVTDNAGHIEYVNPKFCEVSGYSMDEVIGQTPHILKSGETPPEVYEHLWETIRRGETWHGELHNRGKNGELYWDKVSISSITGDDGQITHFVGVQEDITARKQIESALRASRESYEAIVSNVPGMVYQYLLHPDGTVEMPFVSEGVRKLYEIDPATAMRDPKLLTDKILAEDKPAFERSVAESAANLTPWRYEGRYCLPGGRARWFQGIAQPRRTPDGGTLWDGVMTDITARKEAEGALREREARLQAIMDGSPLCIYLKDTKGRFLLVNREWEKVIGQKREDVTDRTGAAFLPARLQEEFEHTDSEALNTDGTLEYEETVHVDGEPRTFMTSKFPLLSETGTAYAVCGVSVDITERKRSEAGLLKLNRLYATLLQINQAIVRVHDRDALFHEICSVAVAHGNYRMAWVGLVGETGAGVKPAASAGSEQDYLAHIHVERDDGALGQSPTGIAIREGHVAIVQDIPTEFSMSPWAVAAKMHGFVATAAVPISQRGKVIGALSVYAGESGAFSEDDEQLLDEIGRNISFALDALDAAAELRASEDRYRALSEASPDDVFIVGPDHITQFVNSHVAKQLGSPAEEIVGKKTSELFPPESAARMDALFAQVFASGLPSLQEIMVPFGERQTWQSLWLVPLFDDVHKVRSVMGVSRDISAAKQAEQEMHFHAALLEAQSETSLDAMLVIDEKGKVLSYNQRFIEMWRIPPEVVATRSDELFLQAASYLLVDPAGFQERVAYLNEHMEEASHEEVDLRDGRVLDRYSSPIRAGDGLYYGRIWFFRDITQQKRAAQELLGKTALLEAQVDATIDGILVFDAQGRMVLQNRRCIDLWNLTPEIANSDYDERRVAYIENQIKEPGPFAERVRYLMEHPSEVSQDEIELKNGCVLDRYTAPVVGADGTFHGRIWNFRDVTERKRAEADLRASHDLLERRVEERTSELSIAKEEADAANKAKSEFLSRMSHELRTPMNAVLGFAQILDRQELSEANHKRVDQILTGGRHLLGLINEVLDIARIEEGRVSMSLEPIALGVLFPLLLDLMQPQAVEYKVAIEKPVKGCDCYVLADLQRLRQVLINLVANAIKYNRPGGSVHISCSPRPNARIRISVVDSGPGIAAEDLHKLFNPFERLGAAQTGVEGTGLGLALSRSLAEAMGGTIGVESEPGVGSTFYVELPQAQPTIVKHTAGAENRDTAPTGFSHEFTVLAIEDNVSNFQLIEEILEERPGVHLLGAIQGRIGLDLARQQHPDVILLDLHLPDIMGPEVLRRLRNAPETRDIPVVIVSADATAKQIERLMRPPPGEPRADAYLTKPLDIAEFLHVLDGFLASGANKSDSAMHLPEAPISKPM